MADQKKVTFYSTEPDTVVAIRDENGSTELLTFKDGSFTTSNPLYIERLNLMADTAGHPITRRKTAVAEKAKASTPKGGSK